MTLRLKEGGTAGAVLFLESIRGVSGRATLTLVHRRKGLMLHGVKPSSNTVLGGHATSG